MGIFITDDKWITLLCKLDITPNQYFVLYMIHTKQWEAMNRYNAVTGGVPFKDFQDLIDRGIIIDGNKPGEMYMDVCMIEDSVSHILFVDTEEAGQQMWDIYPNYIYVNGTQMPTKSTDKEVIINKYVDNIAQNPVRHARVMDLLKFAISNNLITMGIEKWVRSAQWEVLEKEHGKYVDGTDNGIEGYGEREI